MFSQELLLCNKSALHRQNVFDWMFVILYRVDCVTVRFLENRSILKIG